MPPLSKENLASVAHSPALAAPDFHSAGTRLEIVEQFALIEMVEESLAMVGVGVAEQALLVAECSRSMATDLSHLHSRQPRQNFAPAPAYSPAVIGRRYL